VWGPHTIILFPARTHTSLDLFGASGTGRDLALSLARTQAEGDDGSFDPSACDGGPSPPSSSLSLPHAGISLSFFDGCGVCGRADSEVVAGRGLARLAPSVGRLRPRRPAPPRLHQLPVLHRVCMTTRLRSPCATPTVTAADGVRRALRRG
jgi:hypothetical protein